MWKSWRAVECLGIVTDVLQDAGSLVVCLAWRLPPTVAEWHAMLS